MRMLLLALCCASCGLAARDSGVVGSVLGVQHQKPLTPYCNEYTWARISLGSMNEGSGAIGVEIHDFLTPQQFEETLLLAAKRGKRVAITYDQKRFSWCYPEALITGVEIIKE